jgi:excisionase family DNA binding protein
MERLELQSVRETCTQLGIGRTKFYDLLKRGELAGVCRIGRRTLVRSDSVAAFILARTAVASDA